MHAYIESVKFICFAIDVEEKDIFFEEAIRKNVLFVSLLYLLTPLRKSLIQLFNGEQRV